MILAVSVAAEHAHVALAGLPEALTSTLLIAER